jgi:hypothetical protein
MFVIRKRLYAHSVERQNMEDQIGGAWMEEKIYEFIDFV